MAKKALLYVDREFVNTIERINQKLGEKIRYGKVNKIDAVRYVHEKIKKDSKFWKQLEDEIW